MKALSKIIIVLMVSMQLQAQERLISGKVTSASDNYPLPGVTVLIKGSTIGIQTNFDGLYQINAKNTDVLVFSYLGFVTEERKVGILNTISVSLQEDISCLDEVVVMAYGTTTKRSYTASISQIKRQKKKTYHNKLANQVQFKSISNALQGKVSGVDASNNSSNPSTNSKIFIRGTSSLTGNNHPMVVVDGVVSSYNNLGSLNPNSINHINILKDASATSLYGNRASNGVIIISTKKNSVKSDKEPLYIVDGVPIQKENNHVIKNLPKSDIDSKKEYNKGEAKSKFGKIAKNGCIVIRTHQGNFRLNN